MAATRLISSRSNKSSSKSSICSILCQTYCSFNTSRNLIHKNSFYFECQSHPQFFLRLQFLNSQDIKLNVFGFYFLFSQLVYNSPQMSLKQNTSLIDSQIKSSYQPQGLYSKIGILKSNWLTSKGKLRAYNYGTAFLLSPRLLMTCSHNIYSDILARDADSIEFAPGIEDGEVPKTFYRSQQKLIIKKQGQGMVFKLFPLKQELCLILLQNTLCQTYSLEQQLSIASLELNKVQPESFNFNSQVSTSKCCDQGKPIKIIGYPCNFSKNPMIEKISVQRQTLSGKIISINDFTIHHSAQTQTGHSGSPILTCDGKGRWFVIGIHTHKGLINGTNSGLYFNEQILNKIQEFVNAINLQQNVNEIISFVNQKQQSMQIRGNEADTDSSEIEIIIKKEQNVKEVDKNIEGDLEDEEYENSLMDEDQYADLIDCLQPSEYYNDSEDEDF